MHDRSLISALAVMPTPKIRFYLIVSSELLPAVRVLVDEFGALPFCSVQCSSRTNATRRLFQLLLRKFVLVYDLIDALLVRHLSLLFDLLKSFAPQAKSVL